MAEQGKIRVLIVDDIIETRDNLEKLLFFEKDIEVIAKAGTGRDDHDERPGRAGLPAALDARRRARVPDQANQRRGSL